jgi:hypothetical protein
MPCANLAQSVRGRTALATNTMKLMKMNTSVAPRRLPVASLSAPAGLRRGLPMRVRCAAAPAGFEESAPASGRASSSDRLDVLNVAVPTTMKGLGSSGAGATMQRSKISFKQSMQQSAPKLDDGMGGGGLGKGIFNGGGGDGGDDGDDDDYFGEDDGEGDGDGDGFFRRVFAELYDPKAINAVLQEWYRTMDGLPSIIRLAAEMGMFSSAALVRFMSMDVRPNVTRMMTRSLPPSVSRNVVGRLMADPAFMQKLALEQAITIGASLMYEARVRGERFWKEFDLVAVNTLSLAAANAAVVYLVAPTRAAPAPAKHEWQNMLSKLPNNVFEGTTPLRAYSNNSRIASFFVKAAQLGGVGAVAGGVQSALSSAVVELRKRADPSFSPAIKVPSVQQSALGMAATCGIFANARYQIISGFDRYLFENANYLWSYLTLSGLLRTASTAIGEQTRHFMCGLPAPPPMASEAERRMMRARAQALAQQRMYETAYRSSGRASGASKKKRSKSAGFEMGVGPTPVAA